MTDRKTRRRKRYGGTSGALKAAVGTMPRGVTMELFSAVHTPKQFQPLLRPDGPFYGSGV